MKISKIAFRAIDIFGDFSQNYKKYRNVKSEKDIIYLEGFDRGKLDIIYKPEFEGKRPVYINFHGGGYIAGGKNHRRSYCSYQADENGFFVVNANYGLAPDYRFPEFLLHPILVINWVYDNADKYNLDLDNIFVGGDSSGGYMACFLGAYSTCPEFQADMNLPHVNAKIKALLLICGSYDMTTLLTSKLFLKIPAEMGETITGVPKKQLHGNADGFNEFENSAGLNLLKYITKDFPPTFFSHSTKDFLVPKQGEVIAEIFKEKGVNVVEHKATRIIDLHCYPLFRFLKSSKQALIMQKDFIINIMK